MLSQSIIPKRIAVDYCGLNCFKSLFQTIKTLKSLANLFIKRLFFYKINQFLYFLQAKTRYSDDCLRHLP